jgi:hypothetical protein
MAILASFTVALYIVLVRVRCQQAEGARDEITKPNMRRRTSSTPTMRLRAPSMPGDDEVDLTPCNVMAGLLISVFALCLRATPFTGVHGVNWLYLVLQGGIVLPVAFIAFNIGPRYISAAEVRTSMNSIWNYTFVTMISTRINITSIRLSFSTAVIVVCV